MSKATEAQHIHRRLRADEVNMSFNWVGAMPLPVGIYHGRSMVAGTRSGDENVTVVVWAEACRGIRSGSA